MSFLGAWVAHVAEKLLERIRQRHNLQAPTAIPTVDQDRNQSKPPGQRVLLHLGCGHSTIEHIIVPGFHDTKHGWHEIRLDVDERVAPDIIGSMTDMRAVDDAFADAVFSSHGIEHLYWHEVSMALSEFLRILADDGFAVITCPDAQTIAQLIVEDRMFEPVYTSPSGPVAPIDILWGFRPSLSQGNYWMAHRCGFTLSTLTASLREAGFASIYGFRRPNDFDLWVLASKSPRDAETLTRLAADYLPPQG